MSEYSPDNPDSVWQPNDSGGPADLTQISDVVDGAEPGVSFWANLGLHFGSLAKRAHKYMDDCDRREQFRLASLPNPISRAMQVGYTGGGFNSWGIADFGTPQQGRIWTVRSFMAVADGYEQGFLNTFPVLQSPEEPVYAEASGSTVGAVSTALPVNFGGNAITPFKAAYVTGIQLTFGPGTASPLTTVTLSGVEGGPYTWVVQQQTGVPPTLIINFPAPGIPVIRGQQPTLSTSASVGGGTVDMIMSGTYSASRASVLWYVGIPPQITGSPVGSSMLLNPTSQLRDQMVSIPAYHTVSNQAIYVKPGDHLFAIVLGAMEAVDCAVTFDDQIDKYARPVALT